MRRDFRSIIISLVLSFVTVLIIFALIVSAVLVSTLFVDHM